MTWNDFPWFALPAMLCWVAAGITVYKYRGISHVLMLLGTLIYAVFIGGLWVGLERPPMRTVGETRLWYAFFLAAVGYATFRRHRYPWLLSLQRSWHASSHASTYSSPRSTPNTSCLRSRVTGLCRT